MDFGLSDEQQQYLKSLGEFLAAEIEPHAAEMDRTETFRRDIYEDEPQERQLIAEQG